MFTPERWAPFGFVPPLLAGQPALLIDERATEVSLPQRDPELDGRVVELEIALQKNGGAELRFVETVRGGSAVGWRNQLESIPAAELEHRFEAEYAGRLVPGAQLTSLAITGREQDAAVLRIEMGMKVASFGRRIEGGIALPPLLESSLAASYARNASRTTTELIASAQRNDITIRVRPPAGGALPAAPAPIALSANVPGKPRFSAKASVKDGALLLQRSLHVPVMRVTPADYAAFAQFCRAVDTAESQELVVRMQ